MKKRLISWLLVTAVSIMQLLPSMTMIAYADDENGTVIAASNISGKPGDTVDIDLSISNNPGINAFGIIVTYDTSALECMNIIYKDCLKNVYDPITMPPPNMKVSPFRVGWAGGNSTPGNITRFDGNEAFCTIQFKIKETAYNGEYEIVLNQRTPKEIAKYDDEGNVISITTAYEKGKITVTDSDNKKSYTGETPSAPTISNITPTGFDVEIPQENEYTYSTSEITDFTDCTWYTERTVSGLLPNTKYYVYQRVAENDTTQASPASAAAEATTEKYDIRDIIESVSIGDNGTVGTVLKPTIKFKNGFNKDFLVNIRYAWKTDNPNIDLAVSTAETYTITEDDVINKREISVIISADNCDKLISSSPVTAGKAPFPGPVLSANVTKTPDGFIIAAMEGYEYVISDTENVPTSSIWSDLDSDVTVTGKAPGSTWYVFTRVKETDTVNASEPSVPVSVKISSDNSALSDLAVSHGTLSPSFNASVLDYTVIVPYGVNVPTVSAVKQDTGATVSITQASGFGSENKAVITVIAENGESQTTYTVTFIERTVLSALSVNGATINGFSPDKTDYTYPISYADWASDKNKTYSISASANNSANVTISDNDFTLNSDNSDTATAKDVAVTVTNDNGEETVYTVKFVVETCPHTNRIENISKNPTCADLGEKETICELCGKQFGFESIPALGHDFDDGTITSEPDCVNMGTITHQCSRCSESFTRTIPALGHIWGELTVDTAATCTTDGSSSRHCERCGAHGSVTLIPASGHSFGAWTKVNDTTYERVCTVCGTSETKTVTDPTHDHIFNGRSETVTPADCQNFGSRNVYCSVDGCTEFVTETIAKAAHTPNETINVNATCTTAGSSTVTCAVCGVQISETEIPATGHSFTNYTDTATCTLPGIKTSECDNGCGKRDSIPTPAKGHSYGEWRKDSTGHWHECTMCGSTTDIVRHSENEGVITIQPTQTTEGVKTYSCTECGYVIRTDVIDPIPPIHIEHEFDTGWHSDSSYHWHECTVCGVHSDAEQHNENNVVDSVKPTTTTAGTRTYSCSVCGYTVRTETIPPINDFNPSYPTYPTYPTVTYPTNTDTNTAAPNMPYIYNDTSKSGWDAIISEIDFAADESTVRVNMNSTYELPKDVVSRIQNRNINLELHCGGAMWTINGLDVTNPQTVNMRVSEQSNKIPNSVMDSLYSELTAKELRLYHNGDFGFKATLTLNVGNKYNNYYGTLYYYNTKARQLEFVDTGFATNRQITFELTHASYYAIGFSSEPLYDDVSSGAGIMDFGSPIDADSPVTNGVRIPQAAIPRGFRLSNKKRRYRILKKRRLDDLVFVL